MTLVSSSGLSLACRFFRVSRMSATPLSPLPFATMPAPSESSATALTPAFARNPSRRIALSLSPKLCTNGEAPMPVLSPRICIFSSDARSEFRSESLSELILSRVAGPSCPAMHACFSNIASKSFSPRAAINSFVVPKVADTTAAIRSPFPALSRIIPATLA